MRDFLVFKKSESSTFVVREAWAAEALPSLALATREASLSTQTRSLSFRERFPQSADCRRLDEVGEAVHATAFAVRVVDRSGGSFLAAQH